MKEIGKMIKTFEQYNSQTLNLTEIENMLNNRRKMSVMNRIILILPDSWKTKIKNFIENNTIDIDKILRINQKYNIIGRTMQLCKKGITNVKDIYDGMFPKKESISLLGVVVMVIIATGAFIFAIHGISQERHDPSPPGISLIIMMTIVGILSTVCAVKGFNDYKNPSPEEQQINLTVKKDQKEHILVIKVDKEGNYKVEEVENSDW